MPQGEELVTLLDELKRRKVLKVGAAYLVGAWLAIQGASIAFPAFEAPTWALRVFILVAMLGFPLVVLLTWALDVGPEGVKVEALGKGFKSVLVGVLALAALALAWYFKGQPSYRAADVPAGDGPSVAVLPFVNMGGSKDDEYFSDGMTEELLNVLAKVPKLKVAARTSVFEFKGKGGDVRELGRKLGVSHIVEGSVRRDGEQLRITAQLVRVADGFHLWSESYDRELKGVFALQEEIAGKVGGQLVASLGVSAAPAARAAVDPSAYDEYLRGRALFRSRTNLIDGIRHLEAAVARQPDYGQAWAMLSLLYEVAPYWLTDEQLQPLGDLTGLERRSADQAARWAPDSALTEHALGNASRAEQNWDDALAHYLRGESLDSNYPDILEDHSELLLYMGDDAASDRIARQIIVMDPLVRIFWIRVWEVADLEDDRARTAEAIARMRELAPDSWDVTLRPFWSGVRHRRIDEAKAVLAEAERTGSAHAPRMREMLDWALKAPGSDQSHPPATIKRMYGSLALLSLHGDDDALIDAYVTGPTVLRNRFFWELRLPANARVFGNPRTKPLLAQMRYPEYWRKHGWPKECWPVGDADFECRPAQAKG